MYVDLSRKCAVHLEYSKNLPRIIVHVYQVLAYTLYICLFDITLSLDNASFVIIFFFSHFWYTKIIILLDNTYAFIFRLTRVAVSCTKEKKCVTMTINKSYIHCMIYIETKTCTVSHVSGYGWIRKACSFYVINAGKSDSSHLCLKLRKLFNNLYTMIISFSMLFLTLYL